MTGQYIGLRRRRSNGAVTSARRRRRYARSTPFALRAMAARYALAASSRASRAAQQVGARGVQQVIPRRRPDADDGIDERETVLGRPRHADGDRAVELDDRRRINARQLAVQARRSAASRCSSARSALGVQRGDRGLQLVRAGAAHPQHALDDRAAASICARCQSERSCSSRTMRAPSPLPRVPARVVQQHQREQAPTPPARPASAR